MKQKLNDINASIESLYLNVERLKAYKSLTSDIIHNLDVNIKDARNLIAINYASEQDINDLTNKIEMLEKAMLNIKKTQS